MFRKMIMAIGMLAITYQSAHAASLDCGLTDLAGIHVTGAIAGDQTENKLFLLLVNPCGPDNTMYGYIDNSAQAYDSVMNIASIVYATGVQIRIIVDDSAYIDNVNVGNPAVSARANLIEGVGFK